MARSPIVATYSIAACDLEAKQWGVAVQSKFLSVGSVVPWAEPEVGAIATQAYANPRYGPNGLALLREGLSAAEVVERLTDADEERDVRQLGVVDGEGRSASWTGSQCNEWAGHRNDPCYAAQGNILVNAETVNALAVTFEGNTHLPLAQRLLECLTAAQVAGGDRRGQQSASLLVVKRDGGYASLSDIVVDLRVEDHARPIEELRRIYGLHRRLFEVTPREEWLPLEGELRAEVDDRLTSVGHDSLASWAGVENLEERVDGEDAIDPVVLDALRIDRMSDGYEILTLDEVETAEHRGSNLIPVRYLLGFRPTGVNAWIADTGGQLIPPHEEDSGNEELYVVVRGRASFVVGDETQDAPAGSLIFVPPLIHRTATAEEDGTIVFVVGATVGEAFNGGGWDTFAVAYTAQRAGDMEACRAVMEKGMKDHPDSWELVYNSACLEALAGNADIAFPLLERAIALTGGEIRPYLENDSDLDNIRDDPRFEELLK